MRPVPHVRLKYLLSLGIASVLLMGMYLVYTNNYTSKFFPPAATRSSKLVLESKYSGDLFKGHERRIDIFGKLGKIRKEYIETEYQTKPPGKVFSQDDEERMRRLLNKHRRMHKELERKKELFRNLRKPDNTPTPHRDLKAKLHYHVNHGTNSKLSSLSDGVTSKHGGAIKLTYSEETRPDFCDGCMDLHIPYLINPTRLCSVNPEIEALVLVFSEIGHGNVRQAIRETWGSLASHNRGPVRIAFLFGHIPDPADWRAIRRESLVHKDILVGNFVDSFRNLTIKTIMGLHWSATYCPNAKYLVKTDDDMWLNLPKFFNVEKRQNLRNVVTGTCYDEPWHPHRDSESKYYVSYTEYPNEEYPLLCTGTAYIMSMEVVKRLVAIQPHIPYFHLEDVYVALCREKLGIGVLPLQGCFNYKENFEKCSYRNDVIASHWVTPEEMHEAWDDPCNGPDVIRDYLRSVQ